MPAKKKYNFLRYIKPSLCIIVFACIGISFLIQSFAPTTEVRNPLGVGLGIGFGTLPANEFDKTLQMLKDNNSKWVRIGVRWDEIEKSQGVYDWTSIDRSAAGLQQYNINWLMNLNISVPKWANGGGKSRDIPTDPTAYVNFVRAVANHLPNQRYFEISNLPNTDDNWNPAPGAAHYKEYLKGAYVAIKEVRPNSTVLSGGLGYNAVGKNHPKNIPGSEFLSQLYAVGAKPYFDAVSYHTYWWPGHEPFGWGELQKAIPVMQQNGDGNKPIWITEFGPPSGDVGLEGQASLLTEQFNKLAAIPQVRNIMWHDFRDASKIDPEDSESKITKGLLLSDFGVKPAWNAFTTISKSQVASQQVFPPSSEEQPKDSPSNPGSTVGGGSSPSTSTTTNASATVYETPEAETLADVPRAAVYALLNPTQISKVIKGRFGLLVIAFAGVTISASGFMVWKLADIIRKQQTFK